MNADAGRYPDQVPQALTLPAVPLSVIPGLDPGTSFQELSG
jgi:hypothetical protein